MLGSLDPIIIFQLYKKLPAAQKTIATAPITSTKDSNTAATRATIAVIPIYLSAEITGVYIDTESKNIDIDTDMQSLTSGAAALINQKALASIVTVNLTGKQDSIGLTVLLALSELILDRATSNEYEITYMHGGVTVFGGLIHSLSFDQGTENDLYKIKIEISRGRPKGKSVVVSEDASSERLASGPGVTPPANSPTAAPPSTGGTSQISPVGVGSLR